MQELLAYGLANTLTGFATFFSGVIALFCRLVGPQPARLRAALALRPHVEHEIRQHQRPARLMEKRNLVHERRAPDAMERDFAGPAIRRRAAQNMMELEISALLCEPGSAAERSLGEGLHVAQQKMSF